MDALKDFLEDGGEGLVKEEPTAKKKINNNTNEKNMELANMWNDAAEYEEELEAFEKELAIVNANNLKNLATALTQELPDEQRNYTQELKSVLVAIWTYKVETENTHPIEQLNLIKETEFCDVVEKMVTIEPSYEGNFEADVKSVLVNRLEMLISIKKEHLKEEEDELYIAGLKPSFVKRMYKKVHGLI
ncbi:hypothetical protein [Sulfurimonas sp.]|uniref:hypothetical protein n=1 Tax=Sulfurimonas sp. TaxID=2022749 RepID=UPI0039E61151